MTLFLAASGGGHLKQLTRLVDRIPWSDGERVWCTVDTPASRSLLASEEVIFVDSAEPRSVGAALANAHRLRPVLRSRRFTHAISTGASLAVSALPLARSYGASCHYVESAARVRGPSLSGRMLTPFKGVHRYTQHRAWESRSWKYAGSVLDSYQPGADRRPPRLDRVVVTLGTQETLPFRALLERLVRILPSETEVLWQTGSTDVTGLPIRGHRSIPPLEFEAALAEADVVVGHAGAGAAVSALDAGRQPVLVPRRHSRGEHVDDHQTEIAAELARRGLGLQSAVDELEVDLLYEASTRSVELASSPPRLALEDG
jgi:UDP-N-acetylglucosamine transferase subunit ALG13